MVVVHPDDVAVLVCGDDGVCKALVDGDVLGVRGRLVKSLCAWSIGDGVVETRPEDLVAELVVCAVELCIGDPDGEGGEFGGGGELGGDGSADGGGEEVGVDAEGTDPKLLREFGADAVDGVLEPPIAVWVRLEKPRVGAGRPLWI